MAGVKPTRYAEFSWGTCVMSRFDPELFVAEGFDRVELGGFAGRIEAKKYSYGARENKRQKNRTGGNDCLNSRKDRDELQHL